jgi:hypothetical protein
MKGWERLASSWCLSSECGGHHETLCMLQFNYLNENRKPAINNEFGRLLAMRLWVTRG